MLYQSGCRQLDQVQNVKPHSVVSQMLTKPQYPHLYNGPKDLYLITQQSFTKIVYVLW